MVATLETRWSQSRRVIALSCGIKISAVHCLVLSQSARVTDRQRDRRTGLRQQYSVLHWVQSHLKIDSNIRNKWF